MDDVLRSRDAAATRTRPVAPSAHPCFVRDDDAGWSDDRLWQLLDTTMSIGLPVDVAAIPQALDDAAARRLDETIRSAPALVGVHQHGLSHVNHQTSGRKCEFGDARAESAQRADLEAGRRILKERFGDRIDPFFTPPWNRCDVRTPALLAQLGYALLSRDASAPIQHALPELRIGVDWSRAYRDGGLEGAARACESALLACRSSGRPFGLMLHHAAMTVPEIDAFGTLMRSLKDRPELAWQPMRTCVARRVEGAPGADAPGRPVG